MDIKHRPTDDVSEPAPDTIMDIAEWKRRCIAYFKGDHATSSDWSLMAHCLLCVSERDGLGELDKRILETTPPER